MTKILNFPGSTHWLNQSWDNTDKNSKTLEEFVRAQVCPWDALAQILNRLDLGVDIPKYSETLNLESEAVSIKADNIETIIRDNREKLRNEEVSDLDNKRVIHIRNLGPSELIWIIMWATDTQVYNHLYYYEQIVGEFRYKLWLKN
jgi:hypothetical protein